MTCEEIFSDLTNHMLEGLMIHEQFIDYYDFLGLPGYSKCHKQHFNSENKAYRKINHYYITTKNKLLPKSQFPQPEVIPASWRQYTRQDVDAKTKQNAVKSGLEKWVKWETDTLEFYLTIHKQLMDINEVADAEQVKYLILDVQEELQTATQYHLNKIATGYDMVDIIEEQDKKD